MPRSFVIGKLKTLSAYACPMHKCTHSAAGGTIQRLKPGFATVCSRSRNDNNAIVSVLLPWILWTLCACASAIGRALLPREKCTRPLHQGGRRNPVIANCNQSPVAPGRGLGGGQQVLRSARTRLLD